MAVAKYLSPTMLALASLQLVAGLATKYPEVVPGPGLPSLASLGLTSEMLYKMPKPDLSSAKFAAFRANFDPRCGPTDSAYTNVNGVIACFHYLESLGHQDCVTEGNQRIAHFCYSGDAEISGQAIVSEGSTSWCSDVALAALYTIDHCTRPDQSVAGFQAANGNGNLIVGCTNRNYVG